MNAATSSPKATTGTEVNTADADRLIAFQGTFGANSDLACRRAYPYMDTYPCASFDDVFEAVESGKVKLGLVPIENSQAGRVAEMHLLLPDTKLHIVGEYFHRVEHCLLALKGTKIADIKTVYSHPQALMQCRGTLKKMGLTNHHPHSDTAGAARDIAEWKDKSKAAIGSVLAADLYGLDILQKNIEDSSDNTTLFLTLSREPLDPEPNKGLVLTSLLFTVRNIPSSLYKALGGFATMSVNLIKLESYIPTSMDPAVPGSDAQFFITFEGHPEDRRVQLALEELGFFCKKVKVLGIYPADQTRKTA